MLQLLAMATITDQAVAPFLRALARDPVGVTAVEYGLIAGAIAVAIITTVVALGGDISNMFTTVGSTLNTAGASN